MANVTCRLTANESLKHAQHHKSVPNVDPFRSSPLHRGRLAKMEPRIIQIAVLMEEVDLTAVLMAPRTRIAVLMEVQDLTVVPMEEKVRSKKIDSDARDKKN